jgi:uncharacterized protein (TIGR03437 family)
MKVFQTLLAAVLAMASSPLFGAENRIHAPVDSARAVRLRGLVHPRAIASRDAGALDPQAELAPLTLFFAPAPGLEQFLAEQRDPASPNFRKWLSPEEFADRFGLTGHDIGEVAGWLRAQGLRVGDVARGRHWIEFTGTAERVGRAFRTSFRRYSDNVETHYANAVEPAVPEALAGVVASVEGLTDFGARPHYRTMYNSGSSHYLAPEDFASIYNLAPLHSAGTDGTGQSLVVIGQTSIDLADIRAFRSRFGLPANDPKLVLFGPDPGQLSGDMVEADLDLEWAGATAPGATVIYAYARSVTTALLNAIDQNLAPVITMSYGGCEQAFDVRWRYLVQQANAQGITVMVSSGDTGAASCDWTAVTPQASKGATVGWPASVPEITAVGGTRFEEGTGTYWASTNSPGGGSALSYIPESAWNDSAARNDLTATAGGASAWFAKPSWQFGPGVPDDNARDVPDLSFTASIQHVPYLVISGGVTYRIGGTSASSPAFAGILALLNQHLTARGALSKPGLGNINPALYRMAIASPDIFHDVTMGNNKVPCAQGTPRCVEGLVGHDAGPGFDLATGLGSVDVEKLVKRWTTATLPVVTATISNNAPGLDDTVEITATVTGSATVPTGTVTFASNRGSLGTVPLSITGAGAAATVRAPVMQLAGGTGMIAVTYHGDRVYDAASGSVNLQVAFPTTGSVVVPTVTPFPVSQIGESWPYTIELTEKNGVATRLTGFTVNGVANPVSSFGTGTIAGKTTISASLTGSIQSIPSVPLDRTFVFNGVDNDGTTWRRSITVPFVGPLGAGLNPAVVLTATPSAVQQNPQADPSCAWSHQLTVQEQTGYLVQITALTAGTTDLSSRIQSLFGTTRLAPHGALTATVCWSSLSDSRSYQITGTAETGRTVTASVTVTFKPQAPSPAAFTVDTDEVALRISPVSAVGRATASVKLQFSSGSPAWSVRVLPSSGSVDWLKVTPVSGSGPAAELTVEADGTQLSTGAYNATLAIQAADALPQLIRVPVRFLVGAGKISITGASNTFSGVSTFAPGMLTSVYGTGLAPASQEAPRVPLPLKMQGISATVNGVSAPLYYVSEAQVNLQIPYETGLGPAVLAINNGGQVAALPIRISVSAPGLSTLSDNTVAATGKAGDIVVVYMTGEGDLRPTLATGAAPSASTSLSQLPRPRQPVSVTVAGAPATIAFAGIPSGLAGVAQVNFTIPPGTASGPQPLVIKVGDAVTQTATILVR